MEASDALMNAKLAERSVNADDCRTRMASVVFSAGIDSVSGALSKPKKGGQHSCEKMLLATHREAATTSNKCNRLYLRKEIKRSTPVKETEILARVRFATVAAAVNTRLHDVSKQAADIAAWRAQKDLAGGQPTLKAYIWAQELDTYDQAHQG